MIKKRRLGIFKSYDPRTKLHILLMYLVLTLASWNIWSLLVSVVMSALLILLLWDGVQAVLGQAIELLSIELLIGIICIIFLPTATGLFITFKLLIFTIVYLLIMRSMKQGELLDGLAEGFGLRAKTAKTMMLMLDFLPKIYREKKRGRKAQRARGVDPDSGNIIDRFRENMLLAIPNIKYAYTRTLRQSESMKKRQYLSVIRRNSIYEMKLNWVDKVISLIFMAMIIGGIVLMIML